MWTPWHRTPPASSTPAMRRWAQTNSVSSAPASAPAPLRIGILGLGAIGTILFTRLGRLALAPTDHRSPRLEVEALVRRRQLAEIGARGRVGIRGTGDNGSTAPPEGIDVVPDEQRRRLVDRRTQSTVRIRCLDDDDSPPPPTSSALPLDVLVVALKAYDSAAALDNLVTRHRQQLRPDATIVLLQNGLCMLPEIFNGPNDSGDVAWGFAQGVTYVGGRLCAPGDVAVSGLDAGQTLLGPMSRWNRVHQTRLERLVDSLCATGLRGHALSAAATQRVVWRKLIVNAGINPVASLLDAPNQSVGACEWSRAIVEAIVREACAVAASEGVVLQDDDDDDKAPGAVRCVEEAMTDAVFEVARATGSNVCSMLADLRRGSRTEIEAITGQIVHRGRHRGLSTPVNGLVLDLIRCLETQQLRHKPVEITN